MQSAWAVQAVLRHRPLTQANSLGQSADVAQSELHTKTGAAATVKLKPQAAVVAGSSARGLTCGTLGATGESVLLFRAIVTAKTAPMATTRVTPIPAKNDNFSFFIKFSRYCPFWNEL